MGLVSMTIKCIETSGASSTTRSKYLKIETCVCDMCMDIVHMCTDTCMDTFMDVCMDMCMDMCMDVCMGMCTDICMDMCMSVCMHRDVRCQLEHSIKVPGNVHLDVYRP